MDAGAGFTAAVTSTLDATIAVTHGNQTIVNGWVSFDFIGADGDGDSIDDAEELYRNQIDWILSPGPTLEITGPCPGPVTIAGSGFTPGERIAVYRGSGTGFPAVPGGACAGAASGFGSFIKFHGILTADALGEVSISPTVPSGACGQGMQMQQLDTCVLTNVAPF